MSKIKSTKSGKPSFTPEEATRFVQTFCGSTSYQEVAEKLNMDVNIVMYNAQVIRAKGVELPYLKHFPPDFNKQSDT